MVNEQSQLITSSVSGRARRSPLEDKTHPHKQTAVEETFLATTGRPAGVDTQSYACT